MSKARHRLALRLAPWLGILLLGLVWWALDRRAPMPAELRPQSQPAGNAAASQLSELEWTRPDDREAIGAESPVPIETELEDSDARADPAFRVLSGIVLEGGQLSPIPDATVYLERGDATTEAVTDAAGYFKVALPPTWALGDAVGVMIAGQGGGLRLGGWFGHGMWSEDDPSSGRRLLFRGVAALEDPMQFIARQRLDLRGRLVAGAHEAPSTLAVQAFVPPAGARSRSMFAGRARLDEAGQFAIQAWVDSAPDSFLLEFDTRSGRVLNVRVSTRELTSPGGATIGFEGRILDLLVVSEEGAPIAGASVGIAMEASKELSKCGTDRRGRARLLVSKGAARLCVGAVGRVSLIEPLNLTEADSGIRTVVLRALGPDDRVEGWVVDAGDQAIADAFVTIQPLTEDPKLGDIGRTDVRTDADGRFSLAVACNAELRLEASAREFGSSDSLVVRGGERDLRIVLGKGGSLSVRVSHLDRSSNFSSGGIEWILIDPWGKELAAGEDWKTEIELSSVPAGQHELLARTSDPAALAQETIRIQAGRTTTVELLLEWAEQVSGRLVDSAGTPLEGLEVRLAGLDLPAAAAELWAVDRSDADGRFHLLLGHASRAELSVREGWKVLLRRFVEGGDLGQVEVPR